jgi:hypothetical protein
MDRAILGVFARAVRPIFWPVRIRAGENATRNLRPVVAAASD